MKRQHAGHYTCVAKNDVGQVSAPEILVNVQCEYTYRPLAHNGNPANLEEKRKKFSLLGIGIYSHVKQSYCSGPGCSKAD